MMLSERELMFIIISSVYKKDILLSEAYGWIQQNDLEFISLNLHIHCHRHQSLDNVSPGYDSLWVNGNSSYGIFDC